jgi:N-acetylglucosamine-6-phosphate deacetylase
MGTLLIPDRIVTRKGLQTGQALLIESGMITRLGPVDDLHDPGNEEVFLPDQTLAPGLVDLQVNGGDGCLLNDEPTLEGVRSLVAAHQRSGSTTILPTLISCDLPTMVRAREAVEAGLEQKLPGLAGLHLEGPFLDQAKRGAHAAESLRAPAAEDMQLLEQASQGVLLLTLAASHASEDFCTRMAQAGVVLSLGHSAASAEEANAAFDRGVRLVTHLYNAMSPLAHRDPGLVGAALADERVTVGLIADGQHVHPIALRAAWEAKGTKRFLCVSDAIGVAGTDLQEMQLAGQTVRVENGRCVNQEGRLAGSTIVLSDSLPILVDQVGLTLPQALDACATVPARVLGLSDRGTIHPDLRADLIALDQDLVVKSVWVAGQRLS